MTTRSAPAQFTLLLIAAVAVLCAIGPGARAAGAVPPKAASARETGVAHYYGRGVPRDYVTAVRLFKEASDAGDPAGAFWLGRIYATGKGVPPSQQAAAGMFKRASDGGYGPGSSMLAYHYACGLGVAKDPGKARMLQTLAYTQCAAGATANDATAMIYLGIALREGEGVAKDPAAAAGWFGKASVLGEPRGVLLLGECYADGTGVAKSGEVAVGLYRKAADLGDPRAAAKLGNAYLDAGDRKTGYDLIRRAAEAEEPYGLFLVGWANANGIGTARDARSAASYYQRAAEHLARALLAGEHVPKDAAGGAAYLKQSATAGRADAMAMLGECYYFGEGVARDPAQAYEWFKLAAGRGNATAMRSLAVCHAKGVGTKVDHAAAARWLTKLVDAGDVPSMERLAFLYEQGRGVPKDPAKAMALYTRGAQAGHPHSMVNLGFQYEHGYLTAKDSRKAAEWYAKAALSGEPIGMYDIGVAFANGRGVPQSDAKAMEWFHRSAAAGYAPARQALRLIQARGLLTFLNALNNAAAAAGESEADGEPVEDAAAIGRAWNRKIEAEQQERENRQRQEELNQKLDAQYRRLLEN